MLAVCIIRNDGRDEIIMNPDSIEKRNSGCGWSILIKKGTETWLVKTGYGEEGNDAADNLIEEWVNAIQSGDRVIEADEAYLPIRGD